MHIIFGTVRQTLANVGVIHNLGGVYLNYTVQYYIRHDGVGSVVLYI